MKIKTTTSGLKGALAKFSGIVPTTPSLPIMSCVLVRGKEGGVSISGTNSDIMLTVELPCKVEGTESFAAPFRLLSAIVNSAAPGDVRIETREDGSISIFTQSGVSRVITMEPGLYPCPPEPEPDAERHISLPSAQLAKMLSQVSSAAADTADGRKTLENTLLEVEDGKIRAVATNGKVLAISGHSVASAEKLPQMLLPAKSAAIIGRLIYEGDVEVSVPKNASYASFRTKETFMRTRLFDGTYPAYRQVIPSISSPAFSLNVDSAALLAAIRRASVVAGMGEERFVKCDFSGSGIVITASAKGVGDTKEAVGVTDFTGSGMTSCFDFSLLHDVLSSADSAKTTIKANGAEKPVVLTNDDGYFAIIMPIRAA